MEAIATQLGYRTRGKHTTYHSLLQLRLPQIGEGTETFAAEDFFQLVNDQRFHLSNNLTDIRFRDSGSHFSCDVVVDRAMCLVDSRRYACRLRAGTPLTGFSFARG